MSKVVKKVKKAVRKVGRDLRRTFVPEKLDDAFTSMANTEDLLTGKTPDKVAAAEREAAAVAQEAEDKAKAERRLALIQTVSREQKELAARRRARRAGRSSLMSDARLGLGADAGDKTTLG